MAIERTVPYSDAALNARAWIDAAESRWRLQILARRTRLTDSGPKPVPMRIRRFVEGLPWAYVKPAIDYLLSKAPYRGVIANGVDFGVAYRPTLTVWQRDAQQAALGSKGASAGDATYTLIQDLIEADSDDVYAVGTSSSCSEEVVSEYVWDAPSVGELPQGGMGVTYQIANVHRNDDGTFDYAIVKRTALTQHSGPFTIESNALRRVEHEMWDNVYVGADGSFLDSAGAPLAGFPETGVTLLDGGGSREVKISSVSENPDCTLKITVQTETSLAEEVRVLTSENQYQRLDETERMAQPGPLGPAPDATGGLVVRHESKLRSDGTYDNQVRNETEQPVEASVREVSVGRRGRRVVVKSDNQAAPASTDAIGWGGSVRVEKTPGRLYTNTVTTFNRNVQDKVGETCREDQYQHVHTTVRGADSLRISPDDHTSWGDGHVRTVETSMDDDGAIMRTDRDDKENTVLSSTVAFRSGRYGGVLTVKDTATYEPVPGTNTFRPGPIGSGVQYEKTPGGLVTVTRTTAVRPDNDVPVSVTCKSTALEHTVQTDKAVHNVPAMDDASVHTVADDGKHRTTSFRLEEDGGCIREEILVEEQDVEAERSYERKPRGTIITTVQNSTSRGAAKPETVGLSHAVRTQGNRFRLTERTVEASPVPDRSFCSRDAFLHQHDLVTCGTSIVDGDVDEAADGVYRHRESTMDSDGLVQTVERVSTESELPESGRQLGGDYFHTVVLTKARSVPAIGEGQDAPITSPGPIQTFDRDMTQGARWTGQTVTDTPVYREWTDEIRTSLYRAKVFYFRNATDAQWAIRRAQAEAYAESFKGQSWTGGTSPTSLRVSGTPVMNQYGLYDGHYSVEASWDPLTGGADNDRTNNLAALADWAYTIVSNSYNIGYTRNASDEVITSVHRSRSTKTVHETITSGYQAYLNANFNGKVLIEGSHVTVTPSTGIAHGVVVTEANTTISIEDIRGSKQSLSRDWSVTS